MIEYLLVAFVLGVVMGAINRISSVVCWIICGVMGGWGVGTAGGMKAYGELLWGWETVVVTTGAFIGWVVGGLAMDRAIMWFQEERA